MKPEEHLYKTAGVDTAAAQSGLRKIIANIKQTWPAPGALGAVKLDIGYFANVIDIGGIGLAICTDGVGSKSIIAHMMNRYDTIGIDCVAMNVNDAICVGARPISMVDYIAIEKADPISSALSRSGSRSAPKRPEFRFPAARSRRSRTWSVVSTWSGWRSGSCRSTASLPARISFRAMSLSGSKATVSTATA